VTPAALVRRRFLFGSLATLGSSITIVGCVPAIHASWEVATPNSIDDDRLRVRSLIEALGYAASPAGRDEIETFSIDNDTYIQVTPNRRRGRIELLFRERFGDRLSVRFNERVNSIDMALRKEFGEQRVVFSRD
jgi:hypothetical protein